MNKKILYYAAGLAACWMLWQWWKNRQNRPQASVVDLAEAMNAPRVAGPSEITLDSVGNTVTVAV